MNANDEFFKNPSQHPLWERQVALELHMLRRGAEAFREAYREAARAGELTRLGPHRRLMETMIEPVAQFLVAQADEIKKRKGRPPVAVRLLAGLDPMVASLIAVRTILDQMASQRLELLAVARSIGLTVEHESKISRWAEHNPEQFYSINKSQKKEGSTPRHIRRVNINLYNKFAAKDIAWEEWTDEQKLHAGLYLIDAVIRATGVVQVGDKPSSSRGTGRQKIRSPSRILALSDKASTWLADALEVAEVLQPHYLPTLIPPRRWATPKSGGYWSKFVRVPLLIRFRVSQQGQKKRAIDEFMALDLSGPCEALHIAQEVPWKVNRRVLDVAQELWRRGMGEAGLPISKPLELPAKPIDIATNREARTVWKREASRIYGLNAKSLSKTIQARRTLDIAEMFKDEERFYFPHMFDFRGRMYPIPDALQPQGQDMARGLLTFVEGKPVDGAEGWLSVHVANTWGHDKISFEERLAWVEQSREMLERIADDPMSNREWMAADSPFQALAAAFEIVAMWRHGPGYVSSLPIRVDGTCNGLQHLAILAGDEEVARAVNVLPNDKPADIYQEIADATTKALQEDTDAEAIPLRDAWLRITDGRLPRSLTKRPVMILPYGGTMQAFTSYTLDWLEDNRNEHWGQIDEFAMAAYMSKKMWSTVQQRMPGPMQIMRWLKNTAAAAAASHAPLYWTTPCGFVVRHFYGKMRGSKVETKLDGRKLHIKTWQPTDVMSVPDQTRGIAPNFVHSMDASVLIGCIRTCHAENITSITTIHDAFGTVAADMSKLAAVLRECFIANYSYDVLGAFQDVCSAIAPPQKRKDIRSAPEVGTIDLPALRNSDYFFA